MRGFTWAVLYQRPDGWWLAGTGFKDEAHAVACATEQLGQIATWRVLQVPSATSTNKPYRLVLPDEVAS